MKKMIQTLVVVALAVTFAGCKTNSGHRTAAQQPQDNSGYDHGVQGNIGYMGPKATNRVEVDLRFVGHGPAPKIVIPGPPQGQEDPQSAQPQQPPKPYSNPPFPQYRPQSKVKIFDLNRGMAAWHATPGAPIGASVLPPKPLRNVEVNTSVAWNGGVAYDYNYSQGSEGNATVINGQLASGSTYTWQNQRESFQAPVPCPPYGGYANVATVNYGATYYPGGWQKQDNYYSTGSGGSGQYPGYQPTVSQKPTNFYYTH
jgi:hypothetical protein